MPEDFEDHDRKCAMLKVVRNGFSVRIAFNPPDHAKQEVCISEYREQLLQLLEVPECCTVTFDMTGISAPPGGLVGLLASAQACGCEIEILNPSPNVQEILRIAKLDSRLLIRGTNA